MKEKNYNLELIRTISFILVVVIHVTNYYCRAFGKISAGEYTFSLVLDTFARVSVPCFFMLSGALLLGREEPMEKSWMRMLRFFPPLILWSAVYYFWNLYYMHTEVRLEEVFWVPTEPHLWYLYAMIPIYLVLPFFQVMVRHFSVRMEKAFLIVGAIVFWVPTEPHLWYLYAMIPIYLVLPFFQVMVRHFSVRMEKAFLIVGAIAVLVNWALKVLGGELYYDVPLFGDRVYDFYFFLGYYLKKHRDYKWFSTKNLAWIFIVSNVLNIGITSGMSILKGDHMEHTLEYGFPLIIISSAAFFLLMLKLGNGKMKLKERTKKWIDSWCRCSLGIYFIHILFLDMYKKHLEAEALKLGNGKMKLKERTKKWIDSWCRCSLGIYFIHILFLDMYKKHLEAEAVSAYLAVPVLTIGILLVSYICVKGIRKIPGGKKIT